jgi:hypothetical protein
MESAQQLTGLSRGRFRDRRGVLESDEEGVARLID